MIAALFVATGGIYFDRPDVEPWGITRDARTYVGPWPVVAHPPCQLWVNMAAVNWKRYRRELPAWYEDGDDGGCFESALASVRRFGGVLEHPASSHAWGAHQLERPTDSGWSWHRWPSARIGEHGYWVAEVWQSAYGHQARKRTWLLYHSPHNGRRPPELDWRRKPGTHQVGWFDRAKPTLSKRAASATPAAFADALIALANHSRLQDGD